MVNIQEKEKETNKFIEKRVLPFEFRARFLHSSGPSKISDICRFETRRLRKRDWFLMLLLFLSLENFTESVQQGLKSLCRRTRKAASITPSSSSTSTSVDCCCDIWWARSIKTSGEVAGTHCLENKERELLLLHFKYIYIYTHIQVHQKNIEYHEKAQYFLALISESETHILYRFIIKSEIFQAFFSWNFGDYGLQIMKTQNSVSQN